MESHKFLTYLGAKCATTNVMTDAINFNKRFSQDLKGPELRNTLVTKVVFVVTPGRAEISGGKLRMKARGYRCLIGVTGTEGKYIHIRDCFFRVDQRDRLSHYYGGDKYRFFEAEPSEDQFLG